MSEPESLLSRLEAGTHGFGVALIVLGVLAAIAPAIAGAPVVIVIGLLLSVAGAVRAFFGWRAWGAGKGPLGVVVGVLALGCGLTLVFNPVSTLAAVSSLVAGWFVLDGVTSALFSGRLRGDEGKGWILGDAILSILLGLSMWFEWPLSGLHALGVLVGARLAAAGAVALTVAQGFGRVDAGVAALRARLDR